jgi:hypothetical protein
MIASAEQSHDTTSRMHSFEVVRCTWDCCENLEEMLRDVHQSDGKAPSFITAAGDSRAHQTGAGDDSGGEIRLRT